MTENQKLWLKEIIEEHQVAASNERLWSFGSSDIEQINMHLENAEEHTEFADMLEAILEEA
jgi:hypothetical protein